MSNPYIAALRVSGPTERFWILREQRRYELAAGKLREAGFIGHADLFDGFAKQARLEVEGLEKVDQRIAALDDEITVSAIAFGGPLPERVA